MPEKRVVKSGMPVGRGGWKPRWNGDELRAQLSLYDRKPFLDLLAEWLECSPDPEAIKAFSEKYPDRYAGAIRQLAQIGGFTEKREISVDVHVNIRQLSDSQLEDRLAALQEKLKLPLAIEHDAAEGNTSEIVEIAIDESDTIEDRIGQDKS
jgi:hypothetical protein